MELTNPIRHQACSIILLKIDFESITNLGGENTHHFSPSLMLLLVAAGTEPKAAGSPALVAPPIGVWSPDAPLPFATLDLTLFLCCFVCPWSRWLRLGTVAGTTVKHRRPQWWWWRIWVSNPNSLNCLTHSTLLPLPLAGGEWTPSGAVVTALTTAESPSRRRSPLLPLDRSHLSPSLPWWRWAVPGSHQARRWPTASRRRPTLRSLSLSRVWVSGRGLETPHGRVWARWRSKGLGPPFSSFFFSFFLSSADQ